jgi:hypothetical protein
VFSAECIAAVSFMMGFLCRAVMTAWRPIWPDGDRGGGQHTANKRPESLHNMNPFTGRTKIANIKEWKFYSIILNFSKKIERKEERKRRNLLV